MRLKIVEAMKSTSMENIEQEIIAIEQLVADMSDIQYDTTSETEHLFTAVEDAVTDVESLMSLEQGLAESLQSGESVSKTSLEAVSISVSAIRARLGMEHSELVPSTESNVDVISCKGATIAAVEAIGEDISRVWNAILSALKKGVEKVLKIIGLIGKDLSTLQKRNDLLHKRVTSIKNPNKAVWGTNKVSLIKSFSMSRSATIDEVKLIQGSALLLTDSVYKVIEKSSVLVTKYADVNDKETSEKKEGEALMDLKSLLELIPKGLVIDVENFKESTQEGKVVSLGPFVGGRLLEITTGVTHDGSRATVLLNMQDVVESDDLAPSMTLATLPEIKELIAQDAKLIKSFEKLEDYKKISWRLLNELKRASTENVSGGRLLDPAVTILITKLATFSNTMTVKTAKVAFNTIKQVENYISESIDHVAIEETETDKDQLLLTHAS